jgi:hypothetical protein
MPTWRDVEAAKAAQIAQEERLYSLPPGYIRGCELSVTENNTLQIGVGIVEVAGTTIKLMAPRDPFPSEWEAHRISGYTYYVYIDKNSNIHIDILEPVFRVDFMADYHSVYSWRYLGRLYISNEGILGLLLIQGTNRRHSVVVVGSSGYSEDVDFKCNGEADQEQINAAIDYLKNTYGGGEVLLTEGTFVINGPILLTSFITLEGVGARTVISRTGTNFGIYMSGGDGSEIVQARIRKLKITQTDNAGYALVRMEYADQCVVADCYFDDPFYQSLYADHCDDFLISNNFFIKQTQRPIQVWYSSGIISGNNIYGGSAKSSATEYIISLYDNAYLSIINNVLHDFSIDMAGGSIGIQVNHSAGYNINIQGNHFYNISNSTGNFYCIYTLGGENISITNNRINDLNCLAANTWCIGIAILESDRCLLHENQISNLISTTAANGVGIDIWKVSDARKSNTVSLNLITYCSGRGIFLEADIEDTVVVGNVCFDNGADSGINNANEDNFDDDGTDTYAIGNSWQGPGA